LYLGRLQFAEIVIKIGFILITLLIGFPVTAWFMVGDEKPKQNSKDEVVETVSNDSSAVVLKDSIRIVMGTFLGNEQRNYYGNRVDNSLNLIWRTKLGKGMSVITQAEGPIQWKGAGWTGQPLLIEEKGRKYILQGSFDHHLKKIDAVSGKIIWQYGFDDILKGTGTVWVNDSAADPNNRIVILQGSRLGVKKTLRSKEVYSFRAISFFTGKEIWRMNVKRGASYSRDVDASPLIISDTAYIGLENGIFTVFDPGNTFKYKGDSGTYQLPNIHQELPLYNKEDRSRHGGNVVTEASPAKIGNHIYIASGSGHVYGYNLKTKAMDWDFYIGSDIDGSPVVTADSCLIISVERQYISGQGGIMKLDPKKTPENAVVWFFPTENHRYASWQGGVVGSASINDHYNSSSYSKLCSFTGVDGYLYVVKHNKVIADSLVDGPNEKRKFATPVLLMKKYIGPSISTPIFVENKIVAAGYKGIHLIGFDTLDNFSLLAKRNGVFESTPIADDGKVFIASRDGYLYCLGGDTVNDGELLASIAPVVERDPIVVEEEPEIAAVIPKEKEVKPVVEKTTPVVTKEKPKPIVKTSPVKVNMNARYHLIAGAFKSKANALKRIEQLKQKGLNAQIIPSNKELHYVSAVALTSRDLADAELRKLAQKDISTWVFKRN
jgi:outer membrane protein assembly factor BamB